MKIQKLGNFGAVIITPDEGYMLTRYNEENTDILCYAGYTRVACNETQINNYREITLEEHRAYMVAKEIAEAEYNDIID